MTVMSDDNSPSATRVRTLWPLPGSRSNYGKTLSEMLKAAQGHPDRRTYLSRIRVVCPQVRSDKTLNGYASVPGKLGFTEVGSTTVALTAWGCAYLDGDSERVLQRALRERIFGVDEIMDVLQNEPMRIGLLHERLRDLGVDWKTSSQVRYRLQWMEQAGLVARKEDDRYARYHLTDLARRNSRLRATDG